MVVSLAAPSIMRAPTSKREMQRKTVGLPRSITSFRVRAGVTLVRTVETLEGSSAASRVRLTAPPRELAQLSSSAV
jgi:hypothetical protein